MVLPYLDFVDLPTWIWRSCVSWVGLVGPPEVDLLAGLTDAPWVWIWPKVLRKLVLSWCLGTLSSAKP